MRRKIAVKPEPVIAPEILEQAKRSLVTDNLRKPGKCSVCHAETSLGFGEPLCWVCRRLKISAWRDNEQQMPAQE
jgi:hypothetical protein